jgi:8-oxo-dGTP diphosphatase
MRRHGPPPLKSVRYRERIGAYGVLLREGLVLLAEQDLGDGGADLLLPGGGVDAGESPVRALHREVYEETGWRIGVPQRVGVFQRYDFLREERWHARKIGLIYLARPIRPLGPPVEHDHTPVWMEAHAAVDALSVEGEAAMLEAALRRVALPRRLFPAA